MPDLWVGGSLGLSVANQTEHDVRRAPVLVAVPLLRGEGQVAQHLGAEGARWLAIVLGLPRPTLHRESISELYQVSLTDAGFKPRTYLQPAMVGGATGLEDVGGAGAVRVALGLAGRRIAAW